MQKTEALNTSQLTAYIDTNAIELIHHGEYENIALIGQHRAKDALEFGLQINATGYNLYCMGEQASGRFTLVKDYIEKKIKHSHTPDEWSYLNNFDDERQPVALKLPPGQSKLLVKDIEGLIDEVLDTFPAAFDNPGYQRKKSLINSKFDMRYDAAIDEVEKVALSKSVALQEESGAINFSPIINGKPVLDEEFAQLDDASRQHYYQLIDSLENVLTEALINLPLWKRQCSEQLRQLKRDTAEQGIKPLLKELEHKYATNIAILKHLRQLKPHLIDTVVEVLAMDSKEDKQDEFDKRAMLEELYSPNVLVSYAIEQGAPMVYEANPSYQNLFGKIEYTNVQGAMYTNYRMLIPGALHKANGGYLLLDADKLMNQPYTWESLKVALKFAQLEMDIPQQEVGMVNSMTLSPQAIPLNVKVILLGSRDLYYSLQDYDPEFNELFRVLVEFDHEIELTPQNLKDFLIKCLHQTTQLGLNNVTPDALKRLVEFSLREAEHQYKLSARFSDVIELIHEAHFFCIQQKTLILDASHINHAIKAKRVRTGRVSESLLEEIQEGHVLINTQASAIGKVNGLTVLDAGGVTFGTPARITATVYAGSNGVVDIEREVELGQSIHSKGVMLLTGYLGNKYAQYFPLTLSANIALEQSYGYIDGDSASLGELVALISALTEIPVNQGLAVTGSINQYGEVQAVGGVNEKIEGFFLLCQQRGLTGEQGVIIPHSNHLNLVLDSVVIDAVTARKFHIYTVKNVDETLSLLMNKDAGKMSARGRYPKHSIHYHALNRLYNIADIVSGGSDDD